MIRLTPLLAVLIAQPAFACSVCFTGVDRGANLAVTIVMSLLPLVLIFGGVWYIKRAADRLPPHEPRPPIDGTRDAEPAHPTSR